MTDFRTCYIQQWCKGCIMCWITIVELQKSVRLSSLAEVSTVVLLVWVLCSQPQPHTVPLCLISSSQAADYRETVLACTCILLCVRDSMAVHLRPQHRRYAQSHYYATHCNRIGGIFLQQYCSMYTWKLMATGHVNKMVFEHLRAAIGDTDSRLLPFCSLYNQQNHCCFSSWLQEEKNNSLKHLSRNDCVSGAVCNDKALGFERFKVSVSQWFSLWGQCVSCERDCYFWTSAAVAEKKLLEGESIFCVSCICFGGIWHQRQTGK